MPEDTAEALCPICALRSAAEQSAHLEPKNEVESNSSSAAQSSPHAASVLPALGSFGDYELIEEIARGGMGVIYKARQKRLNRIVALKMVLGGPLASPAAHARFLAEAQTAASLQHPNIVGIHEVGEHAGQLFYSMDYVPGRSLAELLRDGPLPPQRAAAYAKVTAEAVQYAHQRGVLHRDLKPSNVLIDQTEQPRITDFGLAKRLDGAALSSPDSPVTLSGQVLGSPNFMSPEQAQGRHREVGAPSDVYSIGALLYHLLTGRPPFQAATVTEVLRQVAALDPAAPRLLNPGLPRDLETICLKCLEKEIPRRYQAAQALADELGRFLAGEPILARPIGLAGRTAKWCRRNPQMARLAGVATLAVLLGFLGVVWQKRQASAGELKARQNAYVLSMSAADQALKAGELGRASKLLDSERPTRKSETDLRGFEWRYLWQQCQGDAEAVIGRLPNAVRCLEVSPDGRWLAAGGELGGLKLWDLSTGEEATLQSAQGIRTFATFSRDSRLLLFTDQVYGAAAPVGTIAVDTEGTF